MGLCGPDDRYLIGKRDLGIRDHGRKKDSMGPAAFGASDTEDTDPGQSGEKPDRAVIVAMNRHTGRVPAGGTGKPVKLDTV